MRISFTSSGENQMESHSDSEEFFPQELITGKNKTNQIEREVEPGGSERSGGKRKKKVGRLKSTFTREKCEKKGFGSWLREDVTR